MYNFKIHNIDANCIAELTSDSDHVNNLDDALDLIGNADYLGCRHIFIQSDQLNQDFFNLKTGLAGEILQKFSTYRMYLAIKGDFQQMPGKSLADFIFESNRQGRILFVASLEEAIRVFF